MRMRFLLVIVVGLICGAAAAQSIRTGGSGSGIASILQNTVDGLIDILDTGGTVRGEFVTRNGNSEVYFQEAGGGGAIKLTTSNMEAGSTSAIADGSGVFIISESINTATGASSVLFRFFGGGVFQPVPSTALAISGTPDTTRDPVTAGTSCRFSAASPGQTWTWPENAVTGMGICCTNTGANSVVVNDSAGVFEGTGPTVGQWDTICAEYVTDRWVQRSFMDN
jgi:hypothetical protein